MFSSRFNMSSKPLFLMAAFALLIGYLGPSVAAQQIDWETDVEAGKKAALQSNRLVWLHFEADWCVPCGRLETFVFSSTGVIRAIDQNVVAVKVDVDKAEALVKKMGVHRVPHDIVMTPAGRVIVSRPSPKTTAGFRKMMSELDRPLQQLNSGNRDAINFGIDQIQQVAGQAAVVSEMEQKSDLSLESPSHNMAPQTIQGQRLKRGFESAKRAAETRAERAKALKQKAELFIASEERKVKAVEFSENPFFKGKSSSGASKDSGQKKPLMLKRDIDSATKNTKSFSPLTGEQTPNSANPLKPAVQTNQFVQQPKEVELAANSTDRDKEFLPPLPPKFNVLSSSHKAKAPAINSNAFDFDAREEFLFSTKRLTAKPTASSQPKPESIPSRETVDLTPNTQNNFEPTNEKNLTASATDKNTIAKPADSAAKSNPPGMSASRNDFEVNLAKGANPISRSSSMPNESVATGLIEYSVAKIEEPKVQPNKIQTAVAVPKAPAVVPGYIETEAAKRAAKLPVNAVEGQFVSTVQSNFSSKPVGKNSNSHAVIRPVDFFEEKAPVLPGTQSEAGSAHSRALQILENESRTTAPVQTPPPQITINISTNEPASNTRTDEEPTTAVVKVDNGKISRAVRSKYALKGKCPVTLLTKSRWIDGKTEVGCVHRKRVYLFASERHREIFQQNPDAFSPLLAGFDPVTFERTKKLVEGDEKHGVFMGQAPNMRVVLFENSENRDQFQSEPSKYLNMIRRAMTDAAPKATKLR
jgi:YHS domain-containing protein